jgi:hypothetical protein
MIATHMGIFDEAFFLAAAQFVSEPRMEIIYRTEF